MLPLKVLDLGSEAVQVRRSLLRYEVQALCTWTSLTLSLLHALTGGNAVLEHLTRTVPLSHSLPHTHTHCLTLSHFCTLSLSPTHSHTLAHSLARSHMWERCSGTSRFRLVGEQTVCSRAPSAAWMQRVCPSHAAKNWCSPAQRAAPPASTPRATDPVRLRSAAAPHGPGTALLPRRSPWRMEGGNPGESAAALILAADLLLKFQ